MFLKKIFLYTNLFIAIGAVAACYATSATLQLHFSNWFYLLLFGSTLCSYCIHWYFTPQHVHARDRENWSVSNKNILLGMATIGAACGVYGALKVPTTFLLYIIPLVIFTFIYTAPKIPFGPFQKLKKYIFAKTFYLTIGWVYATVILPIILCEPKFNGIHYQFMVHRFAFIFLICGLFDYRDRVEDSQGGISSMIAKASIGIIHIAGQILLSISILAACYLVEKIDTIYFVCNFLPIIITMIFYKKSLNSSNETWFYGVLDGLLFINGFLYLGIAVLK
jgi:hypothetical protein